jgi:hypothetical protein
MRHRQCGAAGAKAWLLMAAVSVAACSPSTSQPPSAGSTSATAPASTTGATTSPPSPTDQADTAVGEEDAGTRVLLRPGQRLSVALGADFTPIELSTGGVLDHVSADGGYPTGQPLTTILTATGAGEVTLSSSTDFRCLHESPPCSLPQQEWTLSVTVAGG